MMKVQQYFVKLDDFLVNPGKVFISHEGGVIINGVLKRLDSIWYLRNHENSSLIEEVLDGGTIDPLITIETRKSRDLIVSSMRDLSILVAFFNGAEIKSKRLLDLPEHEYRMLKEHQVGIYRFSGDRMAIYNEIKSIDRMKSEFTPQEIRNRVFAGPWRMKAEIRFCERNCRASHIGRGYIHGRVTRGEILELALKWMNNGDVDGYMENLLYEKGSLQRLYDHYSSVLLWAKNLTFRYRHRFGLQRVDWGNLYAQYGHLHPDPDKLYMNIQMAFDLKQAKNFHEAFVLAIEQDDAYKRYGKKEVKVCENI